MLTDFTVIVSVAQSDARCPQQDAPSFIPPPPPPWMFGEKESSVSASVDATSSMLMLWYMCGFHTGSYMVRNDSMRRSGDSCLLMMSSSSCVCHHVVFRLSSCSGRPPKTDDTVRTHSGNKPSHKQVRCGKCRIQCRQTR